MDASDISGSIDSSSCDGELFFCTVHGRLAVRHAAPGPAEGGLPGLGDAEHDPVDQGVRRPRPAHPHCGHPLQQRLQRPWPLQQGSAIF